MGVGRGAVGIGIGEWVGGGAVDVWEGEGHGGGGCGRRGKEED